MFRFLNLNGCQLRLNRAQSNFLYEKIILENSNRLIDIKTIYNALFELRKKSSARLFSQKDIGKLSTNIHEEIGKNFATHLSGDSGNIRKEKILSKNHDITFDIGINVYRQATEVNNDDSFEYFEDTHFDDESDANIAIDAKKQYS